MADHFSSNNLTVNIHVIDENIKIPKFLTTNWTLVVEESVPIGTIIGLFAVEDRNVSLVFFMTNAT